MTELRGLVRGISEADIRLECLKIARSMIVSDGCIDPSFLVERASTLSEFALGERAGTAEGQQKPEPSVDTDAAPPTLKPTLYDGPAHFLEAKRREIFEGLQADEKYRRNAQAMAVAYGVKIAEALQEIDSLDHQLGKRSDP